MLGYPIAIIYAIKQLSAILFEKILVALKLVKYSMSCIYMTYYRENVMLTEHNFRINNENNSSRITFTISNYGMMEMEKFLFAAGFKLNEMEHSRREYWRDPKR